MVRQVVFRMAVAVVIALCTAPPAQSAQPFTVAVVGDSYTAGTQFGGKGTRAWPQMAWQFLAGKGLPVDAAVNAEGGAGYERNGAHGGTFETLTGTAAEKNDQLLVFFGSINDLPSDPSFPLRVNRTFRLARALAPDARILVIGPAWPTGNPPAELLHLRDSLRHEAAAAGAGFADPLAAGWFAGRRDLIGADGVHPTDAGHLYLAQRIAPLIAKELIFGTV